MRIDLPQCNLKNCRKCFDGNCTDKVEYERCEFAHYKGLARQDGLVSVETYQQILIRYIDAGKYRSADKKVFSENDVVYLIEHGIFPCKTEAEQALERQGRYGIPEKI